MRSSFFSDLRGRGGARQSAGRGGATRASREAGLAHLAFMSHALPLNLTLAIWFHCSELSGIASIAVWSRLHGSDPAAASCSGTTAGAAAAALAFAPLAGLGAGLGAGLPPPPLKPKRDVEAVARFSFSDIWRVETLASRGVGVLAQGGAPKERSSENSAEFSYRMQLAGCAMLDERRKSGGMPLNPFQAFEGLAGFAAVCCKSRWVG